MNSIDVVVLVVDDDPQIRSVFSGYLGGTFEVRTAESGPAAFDAMCDEIDVVLLDRRMPGMTGEELLSKIRDAGYEQPVAMVTAVEPDFDVLEMGFDEYVVKPVLEDELRNVVETMLLRSEFHQVIREYFSLVSKVTALKREKAPSELHGDARYDDSTARLQEIKREAQNALDAAIESGKFDEMFRDLMDAEDGLDGAAEGATAGGPRSGEH